VITKFIPEYKIMLMRVLLAFALLINFSLITNADDWPDWRGPRRDGTWKESGIINKFESTGIKILWRAAVGAGYNGPTVSEGKVYVMDRNESPIETESVKCFDAETGSQIWSFVYDCKYEGIGYPAGPRASVIIKGKYAYSFGSMGNLLCFNKLSGKVLWQKYLKAIYKINMPIWGLASAPIIVGDNIIIQAGGSNNACIIALNKVTGAECWTNLKDAASYSAPILITQAGKKVVVVCTGENLSGLDPETGKIYWQVPFFSKMSLTISSPVLYKNYLFISCFYNGSLLVKLDSMNLSASKVWQRSGKNENITDALHCCISTPLLKDDCIYGIDSYGQLRCLDLFTGDRVWEDLSAVKKDRWANIHLIQNGNITWMFNEQGELIISELSPKGFYEISRAKLIEPTTTQLNRKGVGVTWSHPAFANKCVFIRNDKELVCADLEQR
jgi:outer membrane protein assembly factor BamB